MMLEEEHKNEQHSEEKTTSLPSRLDTHGTRRKTGKKRDEAEEESPREGRHELRKDYYKSPMIARTLLSIFLVLVVFIFLSTFFP